MKTIPFSKFNCVGSLLMAAKKFGVKVEIADEKSQLMLFSKNKESHYVKQHVMDINSHMSSIVTSNKFLTKKILANNGVPIPKGFKSNSFEKTLKKLEKGNINFPLVVKPVSGSQGGAVTVDIMDNHCLEEAINDAIIYNGVKKKRVSAFLVEEYVKGGDYRFLVLDGKILTVMLRKPAYVTGNGRMTIGQLIDEYNSQPGVDKKQPLCPIIRDHEFERSLSEQKLDENCVIAKGKTIFLRKSANISTGGRSFECLDEVHPQYYDLMKKIVEIFGIRFCAVDLMAEDIGKFEKYKIIEINDTPGFDIHEVPFEGKPFRVAERLVELIFPTRDKINSHDQDDFTSSIKHIVPKNNLIVNI